MENEELFKEIIKIAKRRKELVEELIYLENEYESITPNCGNKKCPYYNKETKWNCILNPEYIHECKDYIPEE